MAVARTGEAGRWRLCGPGGNAPNAAPPSRGLVLLAVGSLGRGDLAPGSDLDLVLVHDGRGDVGQVADRVWYPIWDDPMPLDHSVRTLSQASQAAESDLRVAQGLLDARVVVGDAELGQRMVVLGKRLWEKRVGTWLPAVLDARARAPVRAWGRGLSARARPEGKPRGSARPPGPFPHGQGHPGDRGGGGRRATRPRRGLPARGPGRATAAGPATGRTPDAGGPGPGGGGTGVGGQRRTHAPGGPRGPNRGLAHGGRVAQSALLVGGAARQDRVSRPVAGARAGLGATTKSPSLRGPRSPTTRLWP